MAQATGGTKRILQKAKEAGVPLDQITNFKNGVYVPLPWTLPFHAAAREADNPRGPLWIATGGARGPGKTHSALAQVGLDDCIRKPGIKALFLRKKKASAQESLEDKARAILHSTRAEIKRDRIDYANGSRIIIGGYWSAAQAIGYLGMEYDIIIIEEATQLTEDEHDESRQIMTKVRGSLRSTIPGWRARAYLTTNPGGPGHAYFKENFVIPHREGRTGHRFIGGITRFFPATWKDNPFLSQDYIDFLMAIKGPLGKAWRDGDWDTFAGMAFPEWNYDEHTIDPVQLYNHVHWRAVDWGRTAPFGALWLAKDLDTNRIYITREAYQTGLSDRSQARMMTAMTPPDEQAIYTLADPSMWTKKSYEGTWYSTADEYRSEGVILTPGDNDRLMGKRKIHTALAPLPDGRPGLQVFRSCENFIRTFANLPLDPNRPEDVDTDAEDHLYDALKYGLSNVKRIKEPRKQRQTQRPAISPAIDRIL